MDPKVSKGGARAQATDRRKSDPHATPPGSASSQDGGVSSGRKKKRGAAKHSPKPSNGQFGSPVVHGQRLEMMDESPRMGPNASPLSGRETSSSRGTHSGSIYGPESSPQWAKQTMDSPTFDGIQMVSSPDSDFQTYDARMHGRHSPLPVPRAPHLTPTQSIPRSASVPDLNQPQYISSSSSTPDLKRFETVTIVRDEYPGGVFVRKGTALSPLVTARRGGGTSPLPKLGHNRAASYSVGQVSPDLNQGALTPERQTHANPPAARAHRRTRSAELPSINVQSHGPEVTPESTPGESPPPSTHGSSPLEHMPSPLGNGGMQQRASPEDPYTHFTNFQRSTNWRVRRGQNHAEPIPMDEVEVRVGAAKQRKQFPIPAAPISGWKLFKVRFMLYSLYLFYTTWFVTDIGFTIYCQLVKMGVPIMIPWDRFKRAVDWYHPLDATWLETWIVVLPKVVTFTWVWLSISNFFITCFTFKDEPDLLLTDFMDEDEYPSVDILLPRYKEPWDIFMPTVRASLSMDYPQEKINVYICDDGHRAGVGVEPQLRAEFGSGSMNNLHYITRKDGKHAKPGNLNNVLKQSHGDLIVVFDADMVADPIFLKTLIPHMLVWDEMEGRYSLSDVAFVQTTQCFYNASDPMVVMMDGTNLMYYRLLMMGLNGVNAASMVGTGYVLQRAAIKEIHGFITAYSVEDVTTTLALHQRGWRTKYKYTTLVNGLSPATLGEFFKQRLRWGAGSAQLLRYIAPLSLKGLTFAQRLGNFGCHNYWGVVFVMYVLMMARYALWIIFLYITSSSSTDHHFEGRQLILLPVQFIPIMVSMLFLPNVPFMSKLMTMMSMLTYIPVYARITWFTLINKLHPTKPWGGPLRVKSSSEAYGNVLPSEAQFNVLVTFFVTGACVFFAVVPEWGFGPDVKGVLYYVQLGTVFVWVWFANLPVFYEIFNIAFFQEPEDEEAEDDKGGAK